MSNRPKVLIQFDSDPHPSVFDSIVAIDCGVDHLLTFGSVEPLDVPDLVHGAMFTRGGEHLRQTAIFIGGSQVHSAEQVLRSVVDTFFGPVRVSVMLDANGANTTAAAAVLCLQRHLAVEGKTIGVLAATGSVGSRVARLLAEQRAHVRVASRSMERAGLLCQHLQEPDDQRSLEPWVTTDAPEFDAFLEGCDAVVSAGAAGVALLGRDQWKGRDSLKVALDLNAVPPAGIEGIDATANGTTSDTTVVYGAIGVGNLKMKIHKACIRSLFDRNDRVLDLQEIFRLGQDLDSESGS
jgi:hypothetical protein